MTRTNREMVQIFVLSLYAINISSPIPVNISSSSLRYLNLEFTNLRGTFTQSFFLVPKLENLKLGANDLLKGVLPKIHPSNTTLLELDISNTGISGELTDSIGTFSSLNILNLKGCRFSGSIPDSIGNLTQIRYLDFSYNHFTGHIPSTISQLKHLTYLSLSSNSFSGELPDIFSNLQELRYLYLSNNSFIGSFPSKIVSLTHLECLDLSYNLMNGIIPSSVFSLPLLGLLWLNNNRFSGLPDELKTNPTLVRLFLSHNQLSGSIPQGLQFNTFENDSYGGNLDLCGPPLSKQCGTSDSSHVPQPLESEDESYFFSGFTWESVVIGYSFGLVVGTVVWSLVFKYRKPEWFVEFFEGIYPKKMRRSMKRARRRRT